MDGQPLHGTSAGVIHRFGYHIIWPQMTIPYFSGGVNGVFQRAMFGSISTNEEPFNTSSSQDCMATPAQFILIMI